MRTPLQSFLLKAGGWSLIGLTGYLTADALNDLVLYRTLQRLAVEQAEGHPAVRDQLGRAPLSAGPWYNASVDLTHAGHLASCKFAIHGEKGSSDVLIRAVRRGGMRSTLLYNMLGRGKWDVLQCYASLGAGGGLSHKVDLMSTALGGGGAPLVGLGGRGLAGPPAAGGGAVFVSSGQGGGGDANSTGQR